MSKPKQKSSIIPEDRKTPSHDVTHNCHRIFTWLCFVLIHFFFNVSFFPVIFHVNSDQFLNSSFILSYSFLVLLALHCFPSFSLVAVSTACSVLAVCRLLVPVAPPVAELRLWSPGSTAVLWGLRPSDARGTFSDQGRSNPCLLHRQADS